MEEAKVIRPQEGYQMLALSSPADILIGGGAAGAGKTFSLLLDPLRYINVPDFGAVIFRRTTPQITAEGGLQDESRTLYPSAGGSYNQTALTWTFPNKTKIKFAHLEHEKNIYSWQGSQIPYIGFDELTHFSKKSFFYLLSRNRSTCGVKPCVRATCNPDPDSWVYELIEWWIGSDGLPIPERQGEVRYFVKDGDTLIWGESVEQCLSNAEYFVQPLAEKAKVDPKHFVKSITFIGGTVYENKELMRTNPEYLSNLSAQDSDTRSQLLDGNWKVSINPMDVYDYSAFQDVFTNTHVQQGDKRIVVDAAIFGKDKLIVMVLAGFVLIDVEIVDRSSGKDIIDLINTKQNKFGVPNRRITYDANGVGAFIGGGNNAFISQSIAFDNGSKAIPTMDHRKFKNLKTQCYVFNGERVASSSVYIIPEVSDKMYDNKMTIRQRLNYERRAIKIASRRDEESIALIPKDEMKNKYLSGDSPDLMDAFMMNEIFELNAQGSVSDWNETTY